MGSCYTLCSTDAGYDATRCAVLTWAMMLPAARLWTYHTLSAITLRIRCSPAPIPGTDTQIPCPVCWHTRFPVLRTPIFCTEILAPVVTYSVLTSTVSGPDIQTPACPVLTTTRSQNPRAAKQASLFFLSAVLAVFPFRGSLRARYDMPGPDIASGATRAAMPAPPSIATLGKMRISQLPIRNTTA